MWFNLFLSLVHLGPQTPPKDLLHQRLICFLCPLVLNQDSYYPLVSWSGLSSCLLSKHKVFSSQTPLPLLECLNSILPSDHPSPHPLSPSPSPVPTRIQRRTPFPVPLELYRKIPSNESSSGPSRSASQVTRRSTSVNYKNSVNTGPPST